MAHLQPEVRVDEDGDGVVGLVEDLPGDLVSDSHVPRGVDAVAERGRRLLKQHHRRKGLRGEDEKVDKVKHQEIDT